MQSVDSLLGRLFWHHRSLEPVGLLNYLVGESYGGVRNVQAMFAMNAHVIISELRLANDSYCI